MLKRQASFKGFMVSVSGYKGYLPKIALLIFWKLLDGVFMHQQNIGLKMILDGIFEQSDSNCVSDESIRRKYTHTQDR